MTSGRELLLELFSEEIPARMQAQAARDLERMAAERLRAQELAFVRLRAFAGPRRLTLEVDGLPPAQPDRSEERKGPRANAPEAAIAGFLRSTGLAREQLVERDGVLFAQIARVGRPTAEIIAEIVPDICAAFPWPKSMRSGHSAFRWVRPLKGVLCLFGGAVVPFEIDGVASGDQTRGHRFMGSLKGAPFSVVDFADYQHKLREQHVLVDALERRERIAAAARALCTAQGLELVEDAGLLDEVTGLAEWPTPVLGAMDPGFLDLPPEVIRTSMRTHQKYFSVRRPGEAGLAPHFLVVANVEASDGGASLAAGNARVLSARLNDARFFWNEDRKPGAFARWAEKLKGVTFHAKLGSMAERVERIAALARKIAPHVGADPDLAERAARLCKLDLASQMVGEFPELQGVMGGYYARTPFPLDGGRAGDGGEGLAGASEGADGSTDSAAPASSGSPGAHTPIPDPSPIEGEGSVVADAVRDHYKPQGPGDSVPTAPVTVAVALADKLDTLVGFFAIDEKPTGSRDPFALRRAALGVIRTVLASNHRLPLTLLAAVALKPLLKVTVSRESYPTDRSNYSVIVTGPDSDDWRVEPILVSSISESEGQAIKIRDDVAREATKPIKNFLIERLAVMLREQGSRFDLAYAVFALGDDDLVRIVAKVEALSAFLATDDGANLLAGYKRASNILKAEAKKHPDEAIAPFPLQEGRVGDGGEGSALASAGSGGASLGSSGLLSAPIPIPGPSPLEGEGSGAERDLAVALMTAVSELDVALRNETFDLAMSSLAALRAPVDAFFEQVLVNDPEPKVRLNRLRLLATMRDAANRVADFSLISS